MDEESVSNLNCRIPGQDDAKTAVCDREHHRARAEALYMIRKYLGMFPHLKTLLAGAKTSLKLIAQSEF
jgi:hypothetical protein